ncbi:hypothetical protein PHET_01861 [Paragonimus heterotremus]|uniref:Uncharacterized protein n=1 Tax=Paragonimus heterotremus TaxID=100268 RepID=A0A8J4WKX8_9TREM|nr:hypothetical protein PHET_01861 [Paragonimus heterotremus]
MINLFVRHFVQHTKTTIPPICNADHFREQSTKTVYHKLIRGLIDFPSRILIKHYVEDSSDVANYVINVPVSFQASNSFLRCLFVEIFRLHFSNGSGRQDQISNILQHITFCWSNHSDEDTSVV